MFGAEKEREKTALKRRKESRNASSTNAFDWGVEEAYTAVVILSIDRPCP